MAASNVAVDKTWTIKFSKQFCSTFKTDNIQVLDSNGQTYCLVIKKSLLSKSSAQLSKETRMNFIIVKSFFHKFRELWK